MRHRTHRVSQSVSHGVIEIAHMVPPHRSRAGRGGAVILARTRARGSALTWPRLSCSPGIVPVPAAAVTASCNSARSCGVEVTGSKNFLFLSGLERRAGIRCVR